MKITDKGTMAIFVVYRYSRSVAMLQPSQLAISDRYSAIAEQSSTAIDVPLDKLIVAKPRTLRPNHLVEEEVH